MLIIKYIHHQQVSSSSFMLSEFIFSVNKSWSPRTFIATIGFWLKTFEHESMDRRGARSTYQLFRNQIYYELSDFEALKWIVLKVNLKIRKRFWSLEDVWVASESEGVIISVSILCLALSLRCQPTVNVNEFADNTIHQSNLSIQYYTRDQANRRRNDNRFQQKNISTFQVYTF